MFDDYRDAPSDRLLRRTGRRGRLFVADGFRRVVEQLDEVDICKLLARREAVALAEQHLAAILERVPPEPSRNFIGVAFVGPGDLRNRQTPEWHGVRTVRVSGVRVDLDVRDAVRAGRTDSARAGDRATAVGVGAGVVVDLDLTSGDCPVPLEAGLETHRGLVFRRGYKLLGAHELELDRPPRLISQYCRQRFHAGVGLGAVSAAQRVNQDVDAFRWQAEHVRDLLAYEVGHLRRRPDRQLLTVPAGYRDVGLERAVMQGRAIKHVLVDDVGLTEAKLNVPLAYLHVIDEVGAVLEAEAGRGRLLVVADFLVHDGRARLQRLDYVKHGRQFLVLDLDQPRCLRRGVRTVRHHRGNDVADMPRLIDRHDRLILEGSAVVGEEVLGQVLAGENQDHSRHRQGAAPVDADDAGVGVRTAHAAREGHARQVDVEGVRDLAGDFELAVSEPLGARCGFNHRARTS